MLYPCTMPESPIRLLNPRDMHRTIALSGLAALIAATTIAVATPARAQIGNIFSEPAPRPPGNVPRGNQLPPPSDDEEEVPELPDAYPGELQRDRERELGSRDERRSRGNSGRGSRHRNGGRKPTSTTPTTTPEAPAATTPTATPESTSIPVPTPPVEVPQVVVRHRQKSSKANPAVTSAGGTKAKSQKAKGPNNVASSPIHRCWARGVAGARRRPRRDRRHCSPAVSAGGSG